jgi:hypothetical protein
MIELKPEGRVLADVRFANDWRRVKCLDPQVDLDVLEALAREVRKEVGEIGDCATLFNRMRDSFSNLIQLSPPMQIATASPVEEIETLASMFLNESRLAATRMQGGRDRIRQVMRDEFESAGVLTLMKPIPAAPYLMPGYKFEFDFGYRVGEEIKLFHAVSMRAGADSGIVLAALYPKISTGMARVGASSTLTAVVETQPDWSPGATAFAVKMMEEQRIRIAEVDKMQQIALAIQRELSA